LIGKKVLVIGGAGLIGKEIVRTLMDASAEVVVYDIVDPEIPCPKFVKFDISKPKSYKNFDFDVDVLVNCSYPRTSDWGTSHGEACVKSFKENIDLHLNSYCFITKHVAEVMKNNQHPGSIINISSIYGVVSPDHNTYCGTNMIFPGAYTAIKAGIINYSRYIASFYGKYGIRVNCISPGGILNGQLQKFRRNYINKVPLRRMGTSKDVADAVLFLASDSSSYITGHNLMVDGGYTCL